MLDLDKTGFITKENLKIILSRLGKELKEIDL